MAANLVLVRIDDRLIHGQVVVGWVKAVKPDFLVVANDQAANDPLQKTLMEMAATPNFKVVVLEVAHLAAWCQRPETAGKRVLLVFATPQDALRAIQSGVLVHELNVGGMRFAPGKKQLLQAVAVDEQDLSVFRELELQGVLIRIQMVPTDEAVKLHKFLADKAE